jgi:two-component system OmpR family sensor kinase
VTATSIRVRLTLWYGSALALILVLFGTALYAVMSHALHDQVDRSLEQTARVATRAVEERRVGPYLMYEHLGDEFSELAVLDKFFQIFGPGGTITIKSANFKQHNVPLSQHAKQAALAGQAVFESVKWRDEAPIRLLSVPIREEGILVNILQVGTSLGPVEEMLHRLVLVLLFTLPVSLAAALIGGWFLAGRAMRPVDTITAAAQQITAGDLSQRIRVSSPSDELGRLASTFNDMIARLEVSFRQIRQFSADASHELRTPLTVMKGETELALRRSRPAEDYRLVLESNLEEIDRMSQIVDELLFLSRTDLGEIKVASATIQLDLIVKEIQRQAAVLGQLSQIEVTAPTVEPALVLGDELRLRELVLNLVDNAVKYSRPGGKVEISLTRAGNRTVRLAVKDQGIGIAPEDQPHVFDRFYRTEAARAHTKKGTGLGLAICKWIVEIHRGSIQVQSEPGAGSTFTVILPLFSSLPKS